jgi:oxalate decarboxylase
MDGARDDADASVGHSHDTILEPKQEEEVASTESLKHAGNGDAPEPIVGERGASILGPRNVPVELENPDLLASPYTDAGTIPNLKFPYAQARNRVLKGGWGREVNTRELPVAKDLAGVNMRLKPGGIRELHWHKEAEWAYMIAGTARITAVDAHGRNFVEDVGVGDLWLFPAGIPHSIQGLEDGCEFLLVFDEGSFAENETFLISDWFAHTPRDVLAKNFGVPESAFDNLPVDLEHDRWIFQTDVPPAIEQDVIPGPAGSVQERFTHRMLAQEPIEAAGGRVRSPTRATSPSRGRSRPHWSRSSPVACASCTGTRTRTSGSTTSPAAAG